MVIAAAFLLVKYVELMIERKNKKEGEDDVGDIKTSFRDAVLVMICSVCVLFLLDNWWPLLSKTLDGLTTGEIMESSTIPVFAGNPEF